MLRSISRLLVLATILLPAASASAQRDRDAYNPNNLASEITGQLTFAENGAPAQNVPVRLERFSGGIIDQMSSDSRGRFRFANLQRGYYRVIVNAPGLKPAQQEADLQVVAKTYLLFELVPDRNKSLAGLAGANEVVDARIPAEAREEFSLGRTAFAKKSYTEAVTHLQKAVEGYAEFFDARQLLATSYIRLRDWSKAETVLQGMLELKPGNPTTMISLGEVYWRQKRYKDAEETLLAGLKGDEKSAHGYFTLGRLYLDLNEVPKAAGAVGRTLQLKPDFAEAHVLAGNILLKMNQQERALIEYQEYVRLAPKGDFAPQARDMIEKLQKAIAEKK